MSETPQKILVRQWISRAENDLLNVRNNLAAQEMLFDQSTAIPPSHPSSSA